LNRTKEDEEMVDILGVANELVRDKFTVQFGGRLKEGKMPANFGAIIHRDNDWFLTREVFLDPETGDDLTATHVAFFLWKR
jgi:hypothetical protein